MRMEASAIDVGVAHHKFLQDIILMVPVSSSSFGTLFQGSYNVKAIMGKTAPFMVIETDILFNGIWSNRNLHIQNGINGHTWLYLHHQQHARGQNHSRDVLPGRKPRKALFGRLPGCACKKKHSNLQQWRNRHIARCHSGRVMYMVEYVPAQIGRYTGSIIQVLHVF